MRQLIKISRHGIWTIKRIIGYWLKQKVPLLEFEPSKAKYLIFDGTYFNRENCLLLLLNAQNGKAIDARYHVRENYATAHEMFLRLKSDGINPVAITTDGNTSVIRALKAVWPNITIQRCLFHIQRQGLAWLRIRPKLQAAKDLRKIFLSVIGIKNDRQRDDFFASLLHWEREYGEMVESLPKKHKVLGDLQRARSLLHHAWPDMFHYLHDPRIPPTTNRIEGYFSIIKGRYKQHRGLSKSNRAKYLFWYIYLKNNH